MNDVEKLKQVRANMVADLLELSDPANRKASYSIDGQSVDWNGYRRFLLEQIEQINKTLSILDPFEIRSAMA